MDTLQAITNVLIEQGFDEETVDTKLDNLIRQRDDTLKRGGPNYAPPVNPGDLPRPADAPTYDGPECVECGNKLTIVDVGRVCRQCRLTWHNRAS